MINTHIQCGPSNPLSTADADLLVRIGIVLSIRRRAGWHLVRFAVQNGAVELSGTVPTSYDRQLIAALASHVAGVRRVRDELAIGDESLRRQVDDRPSCDQQNLFRDLPLVAESLEDILARREAA
jgi:hypothetical protein